MGCEVICTRSTYHTLQQSNGNWLDASDAVTIPAGNTQIFVLPANCVFIGIYYNATPNAASWQFVDMNGGAGFVISLPFPYSMVQSEVKNRASGEVNINSTLNVNKNLKDMFCSCGMVKQDQKNISIQNTNAAANDVKICFIRYDWILKNN